MRVRAGGWTAAGVFVFLVGWAVLLAEPVGLAGAAGVGGWLLARQYRFGSRLDRTIADLSVRQSLARTRVVAGETTPVTIEVDTDRPAPVSLSVRPTVPPGVVASPPTIDLEAGEQHAAATVPVTWRIAGRFTVEAPTANIRDGAGLFEQSITVGTPVTARVEPRVPRDVHVGVGGEPIAATFGEHAAGRLTSGLEPGDVRQYVPGDAFRKIDWKATARLGEPHVQEFEGESERRTVLIVDHRASMDAGESGRCKLDFARQIALALVDLTRSDADPLGCYTVGDDGITGTFEASAEAERYRAIRDHLAALEPTAGPDTRRTTAATSAARATTIANRLDGDPTPFGRRLRPFFERRHGYVRRLSERPLFRAVQEATGQARSSEWVVILSDDSERAELREAADAARRAGTAVSVFLTPSALFDPAGLGDLEAAYRRYVSFESFRRELAALSDVRAYEVGPGDRLARVLASGRSVETRGGGA